MSVNVSKLKKVELEALVIKLTEENETLKTPAPAAPVEHNCERFKIAMTVGLGCGIPLLSLAMSKIAGTLATHNLYALSLFAFVLMVAVLAVSLPHLAWSIGDITRSGGRASWSLAIALDLSLVLCKFCHVWAEECGLGWLLACVMVCVAGASMLLNCWAFFKAPHDSK
jgi:hypothetical protein